jgi:hypothetical protein
MTCAAFPRPHPHRRDVSGLSKLIGAWSRLALGTIPLHGDSTSLCRYATRATSEQVGRKLPPTPADPENALDSVRRSSSITRRRRGQTLGVGALRPGVAKSGGDSMAVVPSPTDSEDVRRLPSATTFRRILGRSFGRGFDSRRLHLRFKPKYGSRQPLRKREIPRPTHRRAPVRFLPAPGALERPPGRDHRGLRPKRVRRGSA